MKAETIRRQNKAETSTINRCPVCGEPCDYIEERYSFGVYAGLFCDECCKRYRDHCGIDQPQGSPNDLDEQYEEDY